MDEVPEVFNQMHVLKTFSILICHFVHQLINQCILQNTEWKVFAYKS